MFDIDISRLVVAHQRHLMHIELAAQLAQRLGIFEAQQQHQQIGGSIVFDMFFDDAMGDNQTINRKIARLSRHAIAFFDTHQTNNHRFAVGIG